jgi:hypothetical protein
MIQAEQLADGITLYQGDAFDVLPNLLTKSVDVVIADPPQVVSTGHVTWCSVWRQECLRIAKGTVATTVQDATLAAWPSPDWMLVWPKPTDPELANCLPWEPVIGYRGQLGRSEPVKSIQACGYPKPLEWGLQLVEMLSKPGDTILDPFAGSGTIAIASFILGRKCILIEPDPVSCVIIRERMGRAIRQHPVIKLEPVGIDWDGSIKPVNDLTYPPNEPSQ